MKKTTVVIVVSVLAGVVFADKIRSLPVLDKLPSL